MDVMVWLAATVVLLVWNLIYCIIKIVADFRGPRPASGVWGLFAAAGALSSLALFAIGFIIGLSGL